MNSRVQERAPAVLVGMGAALFLFAVNYHVLEARRLGTATGPLFAALLDIPLALALSYGGYRLSRTDLGTRGRWRACSLSLVGAALLFGVMSASVVVRLLEGRSPAEPVFLLLLSVEVGAVSGLLAGYYNARARADARRAERATDALTFVNSVLRHDLRNDLNVIHGHAELADTRASARASIILGQAEEALQRLEDTNTITETLLGKGEREPIDLVPVVTETATRTEEAYEASVTTDLPESAPVCANDAVRSVVDNLLENAVEHSDAAEPEVSVAVEPGPEMTHLRVADNGPGIPDERKEAVFDPGEDGPYSGLELVKTLVESYGGKIRIEDNQPRGTVVVVALATAD